MREMLGLRTSSGPRWRPRGLPGPDRREERPKRFHLRTCHPTRMSSRTPAKKWKGEGAIHPPLESRGFLALFCNCLLVQLPLRLAGTDLGRRDRRPSPIVPQSHGIPIVQTAKAMLCHRLVSHTLRKTCLFSRSSCPQLVQCFAIRAPPVCSSPASNCLPPFNSNLQEATYGRGCQSYRSVSYANLLICCRWCTACQDDGWLKFNHRGERA